MKTTFTSLVTSIAFALCFAQAVSAQHPISKLIIKEKETYIVGPDNVLKVDTLVMQDKATIQFDPNKYGILEAKVATVGNNCMISSKGKDGKKSLEMNYSGEDGTDGGSLSIMLNLKTLGKLTIDTSGGDGGDGLNGKDGKSGTPDRLEKQTLKDNKGRPYTVTVPVAGITGSDGTDATMGGNGGNGGNLLFMYRTDGFIPIFNQEERNNSIVVIHTAGKSGSNGEPGKGGNASADGVVRPSKYKSGQNGQIQLINLNSNIE